MNNVNRVPKKGAGPVVRRGCKEAWEKIQVAGDLGLRRVQDEMMYEWMGF